MSAPSSLARLVACWGIATVFAVNAYANDFAGVTVPGQLIVNDRGYSNYTIPLNFSPGSGGLTPALQLHYGGIGTMSYIGQGWSLTGISTIYRGQKTVDVDNISGNPVGDASDALYLDGSRLILAGVSAKGIATLKSIRADYSSIQAFNWEKPDEYFVVRTKAGLTLRLGASPNSRSIAGGVAYTWHVDKVTDTTGNFFVVTYADISATEKVPLSVGYTGNERSGLQPYSQLSFVYDKSPRAYVGYHFGIGQSRSRLLTAIVESAFGSERHRYSFKYKQTTYWPGAELESLDSVYPNGNVKGPRFQYAETAAAWQAISGYAPPVPLGSAIDESNAIEVADITGGGTDDLFVSYRLQGQDTSSAYSGGQNGWQPNQSLALPVPLQIDSVPVKGRMFVDLDGDGALDLVIADSGSRHTFLRKGKAWVEDARFSLPFDLSANGLPVTATRIVPAHGGHPIQILWSDGHTAGALIGSATGLKPAAAGLAPPLPFGFAGASNVTAVLADLDCSSAPELVYFGDDPDLPSGVPVVYQLVSGHWAKVTSPQLQLPSNVRGNIDGFAKVRLQNSACENLIVRTSSGSAYALAHANGQSGISLIPNGAPSQELPHESDSARMRFKNYDADGNAAVAGVDDATGKLICSKWISGSWRACANIPDLSVPPNSIGRVIVGDFDGNGRQDVLVLADVTQPDKAKGLVFLATSDGYQAGDSFFPQSVKLASAVDFFAVRFVDLNGDGLADILVLGDTKANRKATAYLNTGTGWKEEPKYALSIDFGEQQYLAEALQVVDFTGDGAPDALVCVAGWSNAANCHILTNVCPQGPDAGTPTCFVVSGLPRFPTEVYSSDHGDLGVRLADLNADGRLDVLEGRQNADGRSTRHAWIWDGQDWTTADKLAPPVDFVSERNEWGATGSRNADLGVRIADLNGDRLPDISVDDPLPSGSPPGVPIACDKSRCASAFLLSAQGWQRSAEYDPPLGPRSAQDAANFWSTYADVNGDGLEDLLTFDFSGREAHAYINTGTGYVEDPSYAVPADMFGDDKRDIAVHLLDVNADGLPDLVRASRQPDASTVRRAYLNSGSGWVAAGQEYAPDRPLSDFASGDLGSKLIDVDGNGNPDLLFGLDSALGDTGQRVTIGNLNRRAGLLLRVVDGMGSMTEVTYSANLGTAREAPLVIEPTDSITGYPQIPLNAPMWTVTSTKVSVIGRGSITRQFAFGGFALDVRRGIPLGAAWRRTTDDIAGSSVETHFLRTVHLEGLVTSEKSFDATGLRSDTRNSYDVIPMTGCLLPNNQDMCVDVLPVEVVSTDFDTASHPVFRSRQLSVYDNLGNVTNLLIEYVSFRNLAPQVERKTSTDNTFDNDLDAWHLGRLTHSRVTNWSRDSAPVVTESEFAYDSTTGLLSSEHANSHTADSFTRYFDRDTFGNVLVSRLQAASNTRTEYKRKYDREGRFVSESCNALSHCEYYERRPFDGRVTLLRDPNNETTRFSYDDVGRTLQVLSAGSKLITEYRSVIGPDSSRANFERVTRLNNGDPTIAQFDGGGAVVRLSKAGFNGRLVIETARYDGDGLLRDKTEPAFEGQHRRHWSYRYDAFGRLTSTKGPSGLTTVFESHGQVTTKSSNAGEIATQHYSADRRLVKIVDALNRTVSFHYDSAGRQDRITLANGSEYYFSYDAAGHKTEARDPDRGISRYKWDEFGQLAEVLEPNGTSIIMEYDPVGRIIKRRTADGVTEWTYDRGQNAVGQLSEVANDHGYSEQRFYGQSGRLSRAQYSIDGEEFLEDYQYSPTGALLSYEAPNSVVTSYKYDKNGFVEAVDFPGSNQRVWTAVSYSAEGKVTEARLGDHLRAVTELSDDSGAISRLLLQADGRSIDDVSYDTNEAGYVVKRSDALTSQVDEFSYDAVGQVKGWKQNGVEKENYEYDDLGNVVRQSQNLAIQYSNNVQFPHRAVMALLPDRAIPIEYDKSGRTVSLGDTRITYSSDGLPSTISREHGGRTEIRYGPNGNVFSERTTNGLAQLEVTSMGRFSRVHVRGFRPFQPSGEEYTYRNLLITPSGIVGYVETTKWVFGRALPTIEGEPFGSETARALGTTSTLRFIETDSLGSPRLLADAQGKVIERFSFNPWGVRQNNSKRSESWVDGRIDSASTFAGYGATGATDVMRSGPRLYSPLLGRFLQPDPILMAAGAELSADINPYMFARNSPLRYADPSGLGIFDSIGDFLDHVGGAVVGFLTGGPVGAVIGGIVGLHRAGELIDQYWRPALIIAAGVALTVASGGTLGPVVAAMLGGALAGGLSAALYGGSVTDVLQGALRGALVGLIGGAAGEIATSMQAGILGQMTIGGIAGGYANVVEGGSFEQGFGIGALSAGLAALARNYYIDKTMAGRVVTRAVIGGTAAAVEGGKFENGAAMAAFTVAAEGAADTIAGEVDGSIRGLTANEKQTASDVLRANGMDPSIVKWDDVRIINGQFFELDSNHAITPYGAIFMPSEDYKADYTVKTDGDLEGLFKHEMVHVYQYYRGDYVSAKGFWEQSTPFLRNPYCTAGTQEYEASHVSGYGGQGCP
jgi:RHS repeat-associated protein